MKNFKDFAESTAEGRDEAIAKMTSKIQERLGGLGGASAEEFIGRTVALAMAESMQYTDFRLEQYHNWILEQNSE